MKTKHNLFIAGILVLLSDFAITAPIFTPGSQPTGWLSTPAVTFFDLSSGSEVFYQLDYRKDTWAGNVLAKDVNSTARIQTTGPWDNVDPTLVTAASLLDSANYSSGRKIATLGIAFRWANLSGAQQTAIGSEDIFNFIRGDRANEEPNGLSLRVRESVLGDVLHSNINYWDNGTNQTLFVGANDGMLHAFDANTGVENFAYIPSMLLPNLKLLANKPYVHTHFVDGPISIATMNISTSPIVNKDILVSGLGAGGKGLFALDVTTPTAANEAAVVSKVLWEISATGSFANLGYTYGTPILTKLIDGTPAVIIGNGYMNAGSGTAVLYIINANTGALITAIDTSSGSAASPNGLSTPALYDSDGDSRPDFAYAGDIDGNVWKFNLTSNTSSLLFTTSPTQAITSSPVVRAHPNGGQMVVFATGRILSSGDESDTATHYVYGIWDGAPAANNALLTQTLSSSTYGAGAVRTTTSNTPTWDDGSGNHYGWKVALPSGERVVGEKPFYNNGRIYFLSTNPTIGTGENWLNEFVFHTGGSPSAPIFDLNEDGSFNSSDLAANNGIPVAKFLGDGIFSQPRLVNASGLTTTLYAFHPDLPITDGVPTPPDDPGVSGGHFDFDIYYYDPGTISATPTNVSETKTVCGDGKDAQKQYNGISADICTANFSPGYDFLSDYIVSKQKCGGGKKDTYIDATCNTYTTGAAAAGDYKNKKHEHEYDDKYDVTGVNMLNASLVDFNLVNALPADTTQFKVLVMNQYLNPAAKLSVGGADYENVKTYADLANETDATTLLNNLSTYTRANVGTLIYNLPLDAFKSKDWWGDGTAARAGLIPTQTGCVNKVNTDGSMENDTGRNKGLLGPNGERFNGALTVQLIKPTTPSSAIELNGPNVTYGWRVKQADFSTYVLAEYTSFWHHPNHYCYGDADWVADAPEDFVSDATAKTPAPGSADPKDGVFSAGLATLSTTTTVSDDGLVTTTTTTYSDDSTYTKVETVNNDGSTTIHQTYRDGTEETVTIYSGDGGASGFIDPSTGSPEEELLNSAEGRQTWRDLAQ
jgi:PilC-like protein with beta-propeller domain